MRPPRALRSPIGLLMLVIAGLACALLAPQLASSWYSPVVAWVVGLLISLSMLGLLADNLPGKACPACARSALRRLVKHRNYYRCSACGARCKRVGSGPWLDASGPDDAVRYRKWTDAGIWKGFAVPEKLDGSTSGALLARKRSGDLPESLNRRPSEPRLGRWHQEAKRKVRRFFSRLPDVDE
jgi:hypothetical protein